MRHAVQSKPNNKQTDDSTHTHTQYGSDGQSDSFFFFAMRRVVGQEECGAKAGFPLYYIRTQASAVSCLPEVLKRMPWYSSMQGISMR